MTFIFSSRLMQHLPLPAAENRSRHLIETTTLRGDIFTSTHHNNIPKRHTRILTTAASRSSGDTDLPTTSGRNQNRHRSSAPRRPQPQRQRQPLDEDLIEVLEMASNDELQELYSILYGSSLLSPVAKSLAGSDDPLPDTREALIRRIERRFRFLAADSGNTLRGRWPSYRESLLGIVHRLEVPCSSALATTDLEAEVFLHLLKEHADAVDAAGDGNGSVDIGGDSFGDGMSAAAARGGMGSSFSSSSNPVQRLLAPLKFGSREMLPALGKLGASVAVSKLYVKLAQTLGTKVAQRALAYEAAMSLAVSVGSRGINAQLQGRLAASVARQGLASAASRYVAVRTALQFMGPAMWASTFLDLARMSLGTDHARIVRAVFCLAQIRLTRTGGWSLPDDDEVKDV